MVLQKRPLQDVIPRVSVVHVLPPIVVQTDVSSFRTTVQKLTGWENGSTITEEPDRVDHYYPSVVSSISDEDRQCSYPIDIDDEFFYIDASISYDIEFESADDDCILGACSNEGVLNEGMDKPLIHKGLPMLSDQEALLSPAWILPSSSSCINSVLQQQYQEEVPISLSSEYRWDCEENSMALPIDTNPIPSLPLQKLQLTYTQSFEQSPLLAK